MLIKLLKTNDFGQKGDMVELEQETAVKLIREHVAMVIEENVGWLEDANS